MTDINDKLTILYDVLVDNVDAFQNELANLITQPDTIADVNRFTSLLSNLKNTWFVDPLLFQISRGNKGDIWLCDFLYAAGNLLAEASEKDEFVVPKNLVAKLESWIIDQTGELAWMAAGLLKYYGSEKSEQIQLKKLEERGDFFLTYVECILGLLRFNEAKYMLLAQQIAADETRDIKLREFCDGLIKDRDK
ncbi:hypothetical protein [Mucilaginibacter dorajii]|uniref:Uncharacterized protein n=1 Tax=Mucilaginibacter dorajii TaxID=692994 RepID=A0ABP7P2V0_9SPHI|nr:hypothetical protein [Mucilaginibacter dorajii]MCS3734313.1 hypothetical protein [Mucilaginibacter dorajii]